MRNSTKKMKNPSRYYKNFYITFRKSVRFCFPNVELYGSVYHQFWSIIQTENRSNQEYRYIESIPRKMIVSIPAMPMVQLRDGNQARNIALNPAHFFASTRCSDRNISSTRLPSSTVNPILTHWFFKVAINIRSLLGRWLSNGNHTLKLPVP